MPTGEPATRHATLPADTAEDEDALTRAIIALASQYGRYGYRRITALLKRDGWQVGKDRVERIWRREGLKVPQKQKPRGRLWLNDGSCVRLRPEHANHVWSYDFVSARTHDGRTVRMLNLIDEHTRECLMIRPERRWSSREGDRSAGRCDGGQVSYEYEERLTSIYEGLFENIHLQVMDPYDIPLCKLKRDIDRDFQDMLFLARSTPFDLAVFEQRYREELRLYLFGSVSEADLTFERWLEAIREDRERNS